jgi:hypothetical protein
MTIMGQMGQQQDFAKGLQMLRVAAEHADENAPQGAYVRTRPRLKTRKQLTLSRCLVCL